MTNEARTRLPSEADADASATGERGPDGTAAEVAGEELSDQTTETVPGSAAKDAAEPVRTGRRKKPVRATAKQPGQEPAVDEAVDGALDARPARRRPSLPLVPVLAVLLVLLLGAGGFLWFTRPEPSAVTTDDYVGVLQAARSNVVDFTSFDYLTLDDDIEQIRRVAVGDLRDQAVEQLDSRRQEITDSEAVVSTEVIGAGVTRADDQGATVLLVIQTTRETTAGGQAQVVKYRIEVEMQRLDSGRWVLSRIAGA